MNDTQPQRRPIVLPYDDPRHGSPHGYNIGDGCASCTEAHRRHVAETRTNERARKLAALHRSAMQPR